MKRLFLPLVLVTLVVGFQNCSQIRFKSLDGSGPNSDKGLPNNGTGYGGKPEGFFYRWEPEFTCEGRQAPVSKIEVAKNRIRYVENRFLLCDAAERDLDPALVDRSTHQSDVIGYLEGIYEGFATQPNSIPANLVEIWCRDSEDERGVEAIVHYNRATNEAIARLYYAVPEPGGGVVRRRVPDFPIARVVAPNQVIARNGAGFEVIVHRDRPSTRIGSFEGELQAIVDGRPVSQATLCRLGGSVDPRAWPVRQVVDFPMASFKFAPDGTSLAYTANTGPGAGPGTTVPHLFSMDADGSNHRRASPPMISSGVMNFEFTPDSSALVYWGDPRIRDGRELFRINRDGTGQVQLNEPISNILETQEWAIRFSPDGSKVYYKDGRQEAAPPGAGADIEMWLRAAPVSGGAPTLISAPLPLSGDIGTYDFAISKRLNRVAYLAGGPRLDLFSADLDGANNARMAISFPNANWEVLWGAPLAMPDPGDYVFVRGVTRAPEGFAYADFALAMDGSSSAKLPNFHALRASSGNGRYAVSAPDVSTHRPGAPAQAMTLTDLRTGRQADLASIATPFFTADSSALIAVTALPDGKRRAVSISTETGDVRELCPTAEGSTVGVSETAPTAFLLVAHDKDRGLLSVYTKSGASACVRRNAIPMGEPRVRSLALSPDRSKLLMNASPTASPAPNGGLFYIPLNGEPPLVVDSPTIPNAVVEEARFVENGTAVLYIGRQVNATDRNAFLWRAPAR